MPTPQSGVAVVGSANIDIVFAVERVPRPGETLLADRAALYPGGKGLNQAVAAARAGAATTFIGAIGRDDHGTALTRVLEGDGLDRQQLRLSDESTGQAFIVVDPAGENTIVVASGANATMGSMTDADAAAISRCSVLLMQLELPLAAVTDAARIARTAGVVVMLNAAPAASVPAELLDLLDYLIVNEHEACLIAGLDDLAAASTKLAGLVPRLVVTLGANGSVLYDAGVEVARIPARVVDEGDVVDTTGAGDTFCGALAAALAEGGSPANSSPTNSQPANSSPTNSQPADVQPANSSRDYLRAANFATAAAALSVQKAGAVPSIPYRSDIDLTLMEKTR